VRPQFARGCLDFYRCPTHPARWTLAGAYCVPTGTAEPGPAAHAAAPTELSGSGPLTFPEAAALRLSTSLNGLTPFNGAAHWQSPIHAAHDRHHLTVIVRINPCARLSTIWDAGRHQSFVPSLGSHHTPFDARAVGAASFTCRFSLVAAVAVPIVATPFSGIFLEIRPPRIHVRVRVAAIHWRFRINPPKGCVVLTRGWRAHASHCRAR